MTPTPGEIAYEAFDAVFPADRFVRLTWAEQAPAVQRAWEAAAEAVLAQARPTPEPPAVRVAVAESHRLLEEATPRCMHFGHTMHATQGLCGVASPWVALLPRLVTCQACLVLMTPRDRKEVQRG